MRLFIFLLWGLLAYAISLVQAEGLRGQIAHKIMIKSNLYDRQSLSADPALDLDIFTTNQSNITTPEDLWKQLPTWLQYTFGIIIALLGLVITFYGVRFLPLSVFLLGGFIAAVIMYAILASSVPNSNEQKTAIVYGSSAAVWLVAGVIFACCIKIAVFILGAAIGAIVALVLNPIVLKYVWPAEPLGKS
jgi:hypothetical protein